MKKYHQGKKDRSDESRGMMYSKDSGMLSEDRSSFANLPQDVKMKEYPRFAYGLDPYLNDTASGIDGQIYDDMSQMKRHESKSKY